MKRLSVVLGSLLLLAALSGCNLTENLDAELEERAERGIVISLDYVAPRTGDLLKRATSVEEITTAELTTIYRYDLTAVDTSVSSPPVLQEGLGTVVYAVESAGGDVAFSIFLGSRASGSSGPVARSTGRYACGVLRGSFGSSEITVWDAECPPALKALAESPTEFVSLTEAARKFDSDVEIGE